MIRSAANPAFLVAAENIQLEHKHKSRGDISRYDLINFLAYLNIRNSLNLNISDISEGSFKSRDAWPDIEYSVQKIGNSVHIFRAWREVMCGDPHSPGSWMDIFVNGRYANGGADIVSLLTYITSAQFHNKCVSGQSGASERQIAVAAAQFGAGSLNEQEALAILIERTAFDPEHPALIHPALPNGWKQSDWAYPLMPKLSNRYDFDAGSWPECRPNRLPFLNYPPTSFEICDEVGRLGAVIGSWPTTWHQPLMATFLPCHQEADPSAQRWIFARTDHKLPPFGLDAVMAFPEATVVIDDDLGSARDINKKLIEFNNKQPPMIFVAWPRGLDGAKPETTNWTHLIGRRVICPVAFDRNSFEAAFFLYRALGDAGVNDISFKLPEEQIDGKCPVFSARSGGFIGGYSTHNDITRIAQERSWELPTEEAERNSPLWRVGDEIPEEIRNVEFILEPIMPKDTVTVIYSEGGGGKSWLAMLMAYAVAGGGTLLDGLWSAKKSRKVLYIATENVNQTVRLSGQIHDAIGNDAIINNLCIHPKPNVVPKKLDLQSRPAWDALLRLMPDAEFIIIDNLTDVTSDLSTKKNWDEFWTHANAIRHLGKTILLIHHPGKDGKFRGTEIIKGSVDFLIHLESLDAEKIENGFLVRFEKYRDTVSHGKKLLPMKFYHDEEDGRLVWWPESEEIKGGNTWKMRPGKSVGNRQKINEDYFAKTFTDEREAKIIRLFIAEIERGVSFVKRADIDALFGRKASTSLNAIAALIEHPHIERVGKGPATKYKLADQTREALFSAAE